ncbi:hypothetical protein O181_021032 [Austropuccinia psidii MF-1]|uniref:Uncharacterized protein n=1 Tax=Austropuccinia psidii MF-1 TaxID=1389203 RepID=A0A9Q3GVV8_9BASI|nr:hypothetical protein [Austropuccinia psidii MF-1]
MSQTTSHKTSQKIKILIIPLDEGFVEPLTQTPTSNSPDLTEFPVIQEYLQFDWTFKNSGPWLHSFPPEWILLETTTTMRMISISVPRVGHEDDMAQGTK